MLDFLLISVSKEKKNRIEIYPSFEVKVSSDLMIRGGDFYAVWNEKTHLWSTAEDVVTSMIDKQLDEFKKAALDYAEKIRSHELIFDDIPFEYKLAVEYILDNPNATVKVLHMRNGDTGMIDKWHKYIQRQQRDNYRPLNEKIIFANQETTREDYASMKLPYPIEDKPTPAYDELISVLYSEEERRKIEWAVGAVFSGASKNIQKFLVMYGAPKTGKSTVLNIIQELATVSKEPFKGYWTAFDAKVLGSANASFALEAFRSNPLIAIQHDGDLSRIEDNTRLNSLVSHETMLVNIKNLSAYPDKFYTFLFMGTNKPVKITDSKSGIMRRLIDVTPTGNRIKPVSKYDSLMNQILNFELGGIANHCIQVYKDNPSAYDDYIPYSMLGASNDFYNFMLSEYENFKRDNEVSLKVAWERYNKYNDEARTNFRYPQYKFKEELKSYFKKFEMRGVTSEGVRTYNIYSDFDLSKFDYEFKVKEQEPPHLLELDCTESLFDEEFKDCPAQYANDQETPTKKWTDVTTTLFDISTDQLHYVRPPKDVICIDFDIKDENGNKSFELNAKEAAKWPRTYAELSKGGQGIHLIYYYDGDVSKLANVYAKDIEIKTFAGRASLRRRLSKCNDIPIAHISNGLPLKEEKVVNFEGVKNEKALRSLIIGNLKKKYHAGTKPSIDFINTILEDAYKSGISYDVSDMKNDILVFAAHSTNHPDYCIKIVNKMKFKSEDRSENKEDYESDDLYFFDIEVAPNLLLLVYKKMDAPNCIRIFNPSPEAIEALFRKKIIGHNCRRYDNHILHGRLLGDSIYDCWDRSRRIIVAKDQNAFIGEAWNDSYTDTLDFPVVKQGLKKHEIDLKIPHKEMNVEWDQQIPEDRWEELALYCENDVKATEAVFKAYHGDFLAREILAALTGKTVNDTTNSHTTALIFGKDKHPQSQFMYRDLSQPVTEIMPEMYNFLNKNFPEMIRAKHQPTKDSRVSILPYFPGYKFDNGVSTYKGFEVGEGGFVWAAPGMYGRTITFDVASMHPHSVTSEYLFGKYTPLFNELMEARIAIKHKDFDRAGEMFDGKLKPYLTDPSQAKALANALKIAINSVYGLTAAGFENPFRDPRNVDNIVAKRGALFMIDLKEAVEKMGGKVIHIKTDSIKILDPDPKLQEFVMEFGKKYGYTFEIEHIFEKICLVNNAVYIAKLAADDPEEPGKWTATGTQFQRPFVFKYLFSHEPIIFDDYCETMSVSDPANLYLDFNENLPEGEHNYQFIGRTGSFVPMKDGTNCGTLLRCKNGKYDAAANTKGYRWMESEDVMAEHRENDINVDYHMRRVNEAIDALKKYGDAEMFLEDDNDHPPFDI